MFALSGGFPQRSARKNCIVSLEPLANEIEEDVDLLFMPRSAANPAAGKTEAEGYRADAKRDDLEPLIGGVVDLGAIATEFLILRVDPYPRKSGVVFEAPRDLKPERWTFRCPCQLVKDRVTTDRSCLGTPNRYCRVCFMLPDFRT